MCNGLNERGEMGDEYLSNRFLMVLEERKPGYKYYELLMWISNVVGALHRITGKLAQAEINILTGMHRQYGDKVLWIVFVEVPESVDIEEILEEIARMDVILELKYHMMDKVEIFDSYLFPLGMYDIRIFILPNYVFHSLKKEMIDTLKTGGEAILYRQGMFSGRTIAIRIKKRFKEKLTSINDILRFLENVFRALGWGLLEFKSIDPKAKIGSIIVRESVEYTEFSSIKCHFFRGFITGILREIFEDESINLTEVKCKSEGEPYCEYRFA